MIISSGVERTISVRASSLAHLELCTAVKDVCRPLAVASRYFPFPTEVLIGLHHPAFGVITAANLVTAASLFTVLPPEPGGGAKQVIHARGTEWIINKQIKRPFCGSGSLRLLFPPIGSGCNSDACTLCCRQGDEMTQRDGQLVYSCACLYCERCTPACTCAVCQGCAMLTLEQVWMKNNKISVRHYIIISYLCNYIKKERKKRKESVNVRTRVYGICLHFLHR